MFTDVKAYYNKKEEAIKQLIKETDPKLLEQESEKNSEYESEDEKSELNMSPLHDINQQENKIQNNDLNLERKNEDEKLNLNIELSNQEKSNEKLEDKIDVRNFNKLIDNGFNNVDKINQFFDNKIIKENNDNLDINDDIKIENENKHLINETENLINTENSQEVNRKFSENLQNENNQNKSKSINEMKDIAPMLEKFEKKKKKKENIPEGPIKY